MGGGGDEGEGVARARGWEVRQRSIPSTLQSPAGDSSPYEGELKGLKVAAAPRILFSPGGGTGGRGIWSVRKLLDDFRGDMRVAKITFCFASVPPLAARAAKQQDPGFEILISNPGSARSPCRKKAVRPFSTV